MRRDFVDILLLGGAIAIVTLAINILTDGVAPYYRLLALALAGIALFGVQLVRAIRRARQDDRPSEESVDHEPTHIRHNPNNPFFRELTHDWTGLDEHPPNANGSNGESPDTRSSAERGADD
jgi:hypothetical protein